MVCGWFGKFSRSADVKERTLWLRGVRGDTSGLAGRLGVQAVKELSAYAFEHLAVVLNLSIVRRLRLLRNCCGIGERELFEETKKKSFRWTCV